MDILIIGGTGVLSSAVTAEALHQGFKVTMINRGRRKIPDDIELIKADMNDQSTIVQKLGKQKFDAVIDFLCYTDEQTEKSIKLYSQYTKQYFYISSCAVYDTASLNGQMADEESKKVLSIWKYSIDKWASEQKIEALFKGTDVNYTIIRPCVTYGDTRIPYGISPTYGYHWTMCARILAGKPIITWHQGKNRCNMTRVEDFAVGVVGLIGNPKAYNQAFNVCGDEVPTQGEVLDCIAEIVNHSVKRIDIDSEFYASQIPYRRGELIGGRSIDSINSNAKLKAAVPSFKHTYSLKEGVRKTINAYKTQNYQQGIDWKFEAETDRTIRKWCKAKGITLDRKATSFVNYLGKANMKDRLLYWLVFHNLYGVFAFPGRVKNKLKRVLG